jgi:hypothetical protein
MLTHWADTTDPWDDLLGADVWPTPCCRLAEGERHSTDLVEVDCMECLHKAGLAGEALAGFSMLLIVQARIAAIAELRDRQRRRRDRSHPDAYRAITAAMVADIMSSGEWSADTLDQVRDVLVNRGELDPTTNHPTNGKHQA